MKYRINSTTYTTADHIGPGCRAHSATRVATDLLQRRTYVGVDASPHLFGAVEQCLGSKQFESNLEEQSSFSRFAAMSSPKITIGGQAPCIGTLDFSAADQLRDLAEVRSASDSIKGKSQMDCWKIRSSGITVMLWSQVNLTEVRLLLFDCSWFHQ